MTADTVAGVSEKELAALKRVENAARKVVRYPSDIAPRRSLSNALRNLDTVRRNDDR